MVAGAIQMPISLMIAKAGPGASTYFFQILSLILNFFMTVLVIPVGAIGLCLFYIDQRVRMEGFDIEFMLNRFGPPPVAFLNTPQAPITEIP